MTCCWRPSAESGTACRGAVSTVGSDADGLWWYQDIGKHGHGEFSMAVIQANSTLEDHSQLESGPLSLDAELGPHGTFVGIYDGHGGPETSRFINHHLFDNIKKFASDAQEMSSKVIKSAYLETEEEFLSLVRTRWGRTPQMASVGSCCLVGIICCGVLYIANVGDSRVVLGKLHRDDKWVEAIQLSDEHNVNLESVRKDLRSLHPDDPQIVVLRHNVWRVKGIIQVSRSIGDAYLKNSEFNQPSLLPKFQISERFQKPILLAEPSILVEKLCPEDLFLIFASDGLWEHLTNQEAVELVNNSPREGIARKLVEAALHRAAKKREIRYSELARMNCEVRRHFHDDITVTVLYLDFHLISQSSFDCPITSVKGRLG